MSTRPSPSLTDKQLPPPSKSKVALSQFESYSQETASQQQRWCEQCYTFRCTCKKVASVEEDSHSKHAKSRKQPQTGSRNIVQLQERVAKIEKKGAKCEAPCRKRVREDHAQQHCSSPGDEASICQEDGRLYEEICEENKKLAVERTTLEKEIERLKLDNKEAKRNAEAFAQEVKRLKENLGRETAKLKETQQREQSLQRQLYEKCNRQECVSAKTELDGVKNRIVQMEKKQCNSEACQNKQLKDMNDTIGPKICIGGCEYSLSETLQRLVEMQHTTPSEEVRLLQSQLQKMQLEKQHLQERLDTAIESQGRSAAKDMTIMSGGEYDEPLEEFNEVFTNVDELLGVLESCLEPFQAKEMLCDIFQYAYELCKEAALQRIKQTLEELFTLCGDRSRKDDLGDISRAYGLLLHVSGLKSDKTTCTDICDEIVKRFKQEELGEANNKVGKALALQANQEYLLKGVKVAWKFVTLPSPIIACKPKDYNPQSVEREYGYWDESTPNATLIYTRPVVYRCYDGNRAEKGMVANTHSEIPV